MQVYFYKFLRAFCWAHEGLKDTDVVNFELNFATRKFIKRCSFSPAWSTVPYYSSKRSVVNEESIGLYWKLIGTVVYELWLLFPEHHVDEHFQCIMYSDNSVMPASIEMELTQNHTYVHWQQVSMSNTFFERRARNARLSTKAATINAEGTFIDVTLPWQHI